MIVQRRWIGMNETKTLVFISAIPIDSRNKITFFPIKGDNENLKMLSDG